MLVAVYFLWLILALLSVWNPPAALLVYGFIGSDRDAFAVSSILNLIAPQHKLVTRGLFLFGFVCALAVIYKNREKISPFITSIVLLALSLSVFIVVGSMVKGYDLVTSLSILTYTGLPVFITWLSTINNRMYRKLFIAFIALNIIVAASVIYVPALSLLEGSNYTLLEGVDTTSDVNIALPGEETGKYAVNRYAQYHNPNGLGFYSAMAILTGFCLLIRRRSRYEGLLASVIAACGALGWLNSLTRGPILALLLFMFIALFMLKRPGDARTQDKIGSIAGMVLLLLAVPITTYLLLGKMFSFLIPESTDVSVTSRLDGYISGFDALLRYPVLGVPTDWQWEGIVPHFLPLSFGAEYGIVSGALISVLVFVFGLWKIKHITQQRHLTRHMFYDSAFATGMILIVLSIAATNNIAATVLFWTAFAEAFILTENYVP